MGEVVRELEGIMRAGCFVSATGGWMAMGGGAREDSLWRAGWRRRVSCGE